MNFLESVFDKLRAHPKRVVFPDSRDWRVLQAAARYVEHGLGVAVLLGNPDEVREAARAASVSMRRMLVIDPAEADDVPYFTRQLGRMNRYHGISEEEARAIVTRPNYFGALMIQNGQADALVGGATASSGSILRPLFQIIRPLKGVKSISSCLVMELPDDRYGDEGVFIFADCGVIPQPSVDQLGSIAIEAAKICRQFGRVKPKVAMLSYSTKGSATTPDTEKIVAATELAREYFMDHNMDVDIDGELQVDTALLSAVGERKAADGPVSGQANVLVFPDLNSGNIAAKLVHRLANAKAYGQILMGLEKPAAELSRGASVEEIVGVAAIVGLQCINYRMLYQDQGVRYKSALLPQEE
ncbi:MAG: phosphate acyltransferase [Verrucomicrobiota bacterium]